MTMSRTLSLEPSPFHLNLKWKKQFCFPRTHHTLTSSISIPNNIKSQNNAAIKFKFKCHLNQNHKTPSSSSSSSITSNSKPKSLLESLATTIWNTFRKPAVAALILFQLTTYNPNTSLAASGGRMGGRAFSKSSSSTSTSYSSPSSSSSSSSSGSYSSPSSSSSSSSWSYSAPSRRSRSPSPDFSYSRSYWDKPSSSKSYWDEPSPSPSPSRVEPPSQPSPEFSYSSSEPSPSRVEPAVVDSRFDAAVLFLICAGFLALFLASAFLSDRHEERSVPTAAGKTTVPKLQQNQAISDPDEGRSVPTAAGITTILKLQVGLLGTGRSLQRDLNRIAEVADTSSPEGLNYILTETSLALIRHPDYCISGYSSVDIKQGIEEGEERFNQLSIEERGKFDEETLVNVDNIKRQSTRSQRSDGCSNEYIVITILAAAEGEHKLPSINGSGNLKEALQKLGSIPSSKLLAVEVLWTPQDENDTLLEQELLEDYPLLQPF